MKNLGRWLLNAGAGISLIVLLFTLWSWASSRFQLRAGANGVVLVCAYFGDALRNDSDVFHTPLSPGSLNFFRQNIVGKRGTDWSLWGFEFIRLADNWMLVLPYWFLIITSSVAPMIWLWRRNRIKNRFMGNLCRNCGYDLRASSDRCPECGTPVASPVSDARSGG